ncbi:hypothetical protein [Paractinoplanes lichenicola]|uniref:Bacterial CdiA-CT RNAse A domain-containing protein n=1 Tax=Paractinoplanes lichenicola TaxID=2802976 RepID=A0ABS1VNA4_9ACTN|nr:hypothetical protein [Actinoplanes lichenicola]MBL7256211.1 hypothetical protein [Actinoplanes lichenicola]
MTSRPRSHGSGDSSEPPDPGVSGGGSKPPDNDGPPPRSPGAGDDGSAAGQQRMIGEAAIDGRVRTGENARPVEQGTASSPPLSDDDITLAGFQKIYDDLGDAPPVIDFVRNDDDNPDAHTVAKHGHQVPLRREPGVQTIEGRIYKDFGWGNRATQSFRWDSDKVMSDEVNAYIHQNWNAIRSDLAMDGEHRAEYHAGHRVGEGFFNGGLDGGGPREAVYMEASRVRIQISVSDSDPPHAFVVTAFPVGLLR